MVDRVKDGRLSVSSEFVLGKETEVRRVSKGKGTTSEPLITLTLLPPAKTFVT